MTTRELIMALLLNCRMDEKVEVEVRLARSHEENRIVFAGVESVCRLSDYGVSPSTLVECAEDGNE